MIETERLVLRKPRPEDVDDMLGFVGDDDAERAVERLISLIDPLNTRSIRVAQKLDARPTETVQVAGKPAVVWVHPR